MLQISRHKINNKMDKNKFLIIKCDDDQYKNKNPSDANFTWIFKINYLIIIFLYWNIIHLFCYNHQQHPQFHH